ncbi:MAG TPA: MIP/aquaporin family protein [Acidimicrobiales bacterium]|nr:MIP/aquaporin family protein [Acidimicrobiales bacterium]
MRFADGRRLLAEFLGSGLLVAAVVGSGIAASRLSPGDVGLQLLENATATAAVLVGLILCLGPVSGGHFNPLVTAVDCAFGGVRLREAAGYGIAQVAGGIGGAWVANSMFGLATFELASKTRSGGPLWGSEVVATFGLLLVIFGVVRSGRSSAVPFAVGAYIGAAYFFTSSTSFANPAVTIGRMFSNSFAGIKPSSVPAFISFQIIGAAIAAATIWALYPREYPRETDNAAHVVGGVVRSGGFGRV